MVLRLVFFLLFSTVLQAQHTVNVEFQSAKLSREVSFRIELKLVFSLMRPYTGGGYPAGLNPQFTYLE